MKKKLYISIELKSFNSKFIKETLNNIIITLKTKYGFSKNNLFVVNKKTSNKLVTVLRSPHVNKKSRRQFEYKIYKTFLYIVLDRNFISKYFVNYLYTICSTNKSCMSKIVYKFF